MRRPACRLVCERGCGNQSLGEPDYPADARVRAAARAAGGDLLPGIRLATKPPVVNSSARLHESREPACGDCIPPSSQMTASGGNRHWVPRCERSHFGLITAYSLRDSHLNSDVNGPDLLAIVKRLRSPRVIGYRGPGTLGTPTQSLHQRATPPDNCSCGDELRGSPTVGPT